MTLCAADPPGTALTLVHENLAELAAMPEIAASAGPGWEAPDGKARQGARGRRLTAPTSRSSFWDTVAKPLL
jgi:hypothetical protein